MLEDNSPGQILQITNKCIGSWKSGDCFYWNYDEIHENVQNQTVSYRDIIMLCVTKIFRFFNK